MIVYHGTTLERYERIKQDGIIKASNDSISPYSNIVDRSTTYGYVYLTSKVQGINGAIDFANRNFIQCHVNNGDYAASMSRILVIIKLEINNDLLENDKDEELFGDSTCDCCFRYKGDIDIKEATRIAFKFPNYQKCCDYYDRLTADKIDALEWRRIVS